ncbi:perlucin-like protein [Saccostrea cucullata]|uniref:perlucin-like protein n=1 Tax=Saccostrea cuccullata TaxID=36930 RepID=UPI002ED32C9E
MLRSFLIIATMNTSSFTVLCLLILHRNVAQLLTKSNNYDDVSKQCIDRELRILKKIFMEEIAKFRLEMKSLPVNTEPFVSCPAGWIQFQSSCYIFGYDYGNWTHGKNQCERKHGSSKYLRITSKAEDTFIRDYVKGQGLTDYKTRDFWIGGTDAAQDGVFMWEGHSQEFTYTNWGPGNPDRTGTADCVILFQRSQYKWHDTSCSNDNSYICEIEL